MIETKPSPCECIIFMHSVPPSPPPSTYGSGAGTKIEKIIELCLPFKQIFFIFEVIKWQWITSQENQVETVQINSATQWTSEVTAY